MIYLDETFSIEELLPEIKKVERPQKLEAEVYKLKSPVITNSIYVTIGYIKVNDKRKPFEIFINSKDLSKAAEYSILTRLISAIFRSTDNPEFVIEELRSIYDPNGGYFKEGKYMHSFYSEIADIIEQALNGTFDKKSKIQTVSTGLKLCPKCNKLTAKYENGCITCIDTECGYSKCDH